MTGEASEARSSRATSKPMPNSSRDDHHSKTTQAKVPRTYMPERVGRWEAGPGWNWRIDHQGELAPANIVSRSPRPMQ